VVAFDMRRCRSCAIGDARKRPRALLPRGLALRIAVGGQRRFSAAIALAYIEPEIATTPSNAMDVNANNMNRSL
jgi:hypothetical protein